VSLFITKLLDAIYPLLLVFKMQTIHTDIYSIHILNSTIGEATSHTPTQKSVNCTKNQHHCANNEQEHSLLFIKHDAQNSRNMHRNNLTRKASVIKK
jgi:hypothetical protein